jgi:two-component sensor histidine kinase
LFVSAAWIAPAILGGINEYAQQRFSGQAAIDIRPILFTSGDWFLYAFLTPAVFAVSRRWPLERPRLASRIAIHLLVALLFCAVWAGAGTLLRALLMPDGLWSGLGEHFVRWTFITFPFGVAVYLSLVGIEHAFHYVGEVHERELQMARLSEQLSGARFAALQAQVNPHFLFNTLNTIAVLVRDVDTAGATRIIEQLSDLLRRTLRQDRANEVTMDEELALVRQYLAIEQARFSDRLRASFDIAGTTRAAAVPGFAIQHLVENAIRHGIAQRPEAGEVTVTTRRVGDALEVAVSDDGPGFAAGATSASGHGLENTRERLRALFGDRASLTVTRTPDDRTVATLRVPFRELEAAS